MKSDQKLRLYGVYRQDKEGHFMLRVKIPAGFLTSEQATEISVISKEYSNGMLHLTSRGSIEFHWLKHDQLDDIFVRLTNVGLTTRGACGGAVRGISCSTSFASEFPVIQAVAHKLNRHFAGNSDFEGLPKKFKVGIDAGYQGARHLIQDIGLVLVDAKSEQASFDVWCAGGLGREPQLGFLLEQAVPEGQLTHLIESVVQVYRENTPPPKRLKFFLNKIGEEEFRRLLKAEMAQRPYVEQLDVGYFQLIAPRGTFLEIPVFAGELSADILHRLAAISSEHAGGYLATTANQNIALLTESAKEEKSFKKALEQGNIKTELLGSISVFRVCPGSHECRMGLSATREVAQQITTVVNEAAKDKSWAISGCRNSCSQPQLADYGVVTSNLDTTEADFSFPRFDLYRRDDEKFGRCIAEGLSATALYELIQTLQ